MALCSVVFDEWCQEDSLLLDQSRALQDIEFLTHRTGDLVADTLYNAALFVVQAPRDCRGNLVNALKSPFAAVDAQTIPKHAVAEEGTNAVHYRESNASRVTGENCQRNVNSQLSRVVFHLAQH